MQQKGSLMNSSQKIYLIDPPSPFATLETWERHLTYLKSLPDDALLKREMLQTAEETIRLKKSNSLSSPASAKAGRPPTNT
jgi:hypothetical protein